MEFQELYSTVAGITASILCSPKQMELGPMRTLLYGAIVGTCAEASTYPFEVVRRQLQMQVQATKLSTLATYAKIVEQRGIPTLERALTRFYSDLIPLVENFVRRRMEKKGDERERKKLEGSGRGQKDDWSVSDLKDAYDAGGVIMDFGSNAIAVVMINFVFSEERKLNRAVEEDGVGKLDLGNGIRN
ncbi:hypothetical protein IFM89_005045 [Coptis chinensis]|uniref:Uncharacterized protein n=1 Tax=Coptis chinensis TaxID=261450 RepID=A0A835LUR3_9MAGN|nr:hypothetical protein IFM89_005045 [Coptis chinensis]